jgi:hypothetical protein
MILSIFSIFGIFLILELLNPEWLEFKIIIMEKYLY